MMIDPSELLRHSLTSALRARGLTVAGWCKRAEIPESTLRNFLKGRSETLTLTSLMALARAIDEPVSTLLGETPPSTHDYAVVSEEVIDEWRDSPRISDSKEFVISLPDDFRFQNLVHSGAVIKDDSADLLYPPGTIVTYVSYQLAEIDLQEGDIVLLRAHKEFDDNIDGVSGKYHLSIRRVVESKGSLWLTSCCSDPIRFPPMPAPERNGFDHNESEELYYQEMLSYLDYQDGSPIYYCVLGLINASYRREGSPDRTQRKSHHNAKDVD